MTAYETFSEEYDVIQILQNFGFEIDGENENSTTNLPKSSTTSKSLTSSSFGSSSSTTTSSSNMAHYIGSNSLIIYINLIIFSLNFIL